MAIRTDGWPAVEGMVVKPRGALWPLATQVIVVPFEMQDRPEPVNVDILQVVLVPRASWERITSHVPAEVLEREGAKHG
ncbi:hypothetical protein FEO91_08335 [Stenotrophomonas maltophilia]|nr:hypothetical protein FEO91_08335 [Stenotrophomonas maltophilia]